MPAGKAKQAPASNAARTLASFGPRRPIRSAFLGVKQAKVGLGPFAVADPTEKATVTEAKNAAQPHLDNMGASIHFQWGGWNLTPDRERAQITKQRKGAPHFASCSGATICALGRVFPGRALLARQGGPSYIPDQTRVFPRACNFPIRKTR